MQGKNSFSSIKLSYLCDGCKLEDLLLDKWYALEDSG